MTTQRLFVIGILAGIGLVASGGSAFSQEPAPKDLVVRFCDLDAQGEQLTPEGWQKVAALFASPGQRRLGRIMVVKDFAVSRPFPEKSKVGFTADYSPLGWIDTERGRFSRLPHSLEVRADFFVIKRSAPGSGSATEWLIEGPVPNPHLTLEAAIRYATDLRAKTKDDATRKNADGMLIALKRLE